MPALGCFLNVCVYVCVVRVDGCSLGHVLKVCTVCPGANSENAYPKGVSYLRGVFS